MNRVILTVAFLFGVYVIGYCQFSLVGNWRRIYPNLKNQDLKSKELQKWDLVIFADSTFHIIGDTANQNPGLSGWHVGEDQKGSWENKDNSHLLLWIGNKKDMMFINYIIVKLTQTKLILTTSPDSKGKKHNIIYVRLRDLQAKRLLRKAGHDKLRSANTSTNPNRRRSPRLCQLVTIMQLGNFAFSTPGLSSKISQVGLRKNY